MFSLTKSIRSRRESARNRGAFNRSAASPLIRDEVINGIERTGGPFRLR